MARTCLPSVHTFAFGLSASAQEAALRPKQVNQTAAEYSSKCRWADRNKIIGPTIGPPITEEPEPENPMNVSLIKNNAERILSGSYDTSKVQMG